MGIAPFHLDFLQCFDMDMMQVLVEEIGTKVIFEEVMAKYCQFSEIWRIELSGEVRRVCISARLQIFLSTKIFPIMNIAHS